jgi:hypothetical protein
MNKIIFKKLYCEATNTYTIVDTVLVPISIGTYTDVYDQYTYSEIYEDTNYLFEEPCTEEEWLAAIKEIKSKINLGWGIPLTREDFYNQILQPNLKINYA